MYCPSHLSWFNSNNILWGVQIIRLLAMQFSPASYDKWKFFKLFGSKVSITGFPSPLFAVPTRQLLWHISSSGSLNAQASRRWPGPCLVRGWQFLSFSLLPLFGIKGGLGDQYAVYVPLCVSAPNFFVFYSVLVVSKKSGQLVLPRTSCFSSAFLFFPDISNYIQKDPQKHD
jgi:hypothetical protein